MIGDDDFRVELLLFSVNIDVMFHVLMLSKIMHMSQNMCHMNIDKHCVGVMIRNLSRCEIALGTLTSRRLSNLLYVLRSIILVIYESEPGRGDVVIVLRIAAQMVSFE